MTKQLTRRWERSQEALLAGVFEGLSRFTGYQVWTLRLLAIALSFFYGLGILLYLILVLILPYEGQSNKQGQAYFLGVCASLSKEKNLDLVFLRAAWILGGLASFGLLSFYYFYLAYDLIKKQKRRIQEI